MNRTKTTFLLPRMVWEAVKILHSNFDKLSESISDVIKLVLSFLGSQTGEWIRENVFVPLLKDSSVVRSSFCLSQAKGGL